jgi:hypothetical protein
MLLTASERNYASNLSEQITKQYKFPLLQVDGLGIPLLMVDIGSLWWVGGVNL